MARHDIESLDPDKNTATLALDAGVYPIDVIYGAAYALIDRVWVLLDRTAAPNGKGHRFHVHLRGKVQLGEVGLQALSGQFGNELLSQALRRKVVKQNSKIIEEIVTQAIAGAAGATLPQDFMEEDDDLDFLDDPLGIAVPWEEKFKKDKGGKQA
jgi:His-Xaa-Ser system protein HxsD